ncbi:MAG TPA: cell division protein ZipA C-terminal FtsZ-binding domain-containing protein [Steroidobacteraceae bacterium]|nr:cell division protein ZipA C-terminal FtsZ-binding domain-containing protein [Steroidobacteraceae bacterium]
MTELRWWLLILGVAFFAGLTWWELRRPRQARQREAPPEPTRPREPALQLPEMHAVESLATRDHLPMIELADDTGSFPVLEAATPEAGSEEQGEMPTDAGEAPAPGEAPLEAGFEIPPESSLSGESCPPDAVEPLVEWPPDEERRVVALRLVAPQPERFAGRSLRQALAAEGFVLGRFDIFHKPDDTQRAILSAASLSRPGTFDAETMDSQHFGGLSLFAVLPGPMSPPEAFEELVATARHLNDRLCGVLQDEGGTPLTPARIASLRERLASGMSS